MGETGGKEDWEGMEKICNTGFAGKVKKKQITKSPAFIQKEFDY